MRTQGKLFKVSTAAALAGLLAGTALAPVALAQPMPPPGAGDQQPSEDPPVRVGRLARTSGTVSFHTAGDTQWSPAAVNYPVATGSAFWTEPTASAVLEVGSSRITLGGGTAFDIASLDPGGLQATLGQGAAAISARGLASGEVWAIQTPRGLVTLRGDGRYQVVAGDTQTPTMVTVQQGAAEVTGPDLQTVVEAGQTATITGTSILQASIGPARPDPELTGILARERPQVIPPPPPPAVVAMPGVEDLGAYGAWDTMPDYGPVWYPQVGPDWAPYRDGHWAYIAPWGWTWVDDDAWGFAPFHYGRWAHLHGRWAWVPGREPGRPVYAPALVAFIGLGAGVGLGAALAAGSVGWIPLGPREAYHPWYHASERYTREVNAEHGMRVRDVDGYANRGAAVVVPAGVMVGSRPVRQAAQPLSPQALAGARPLAGQEPLRPTIATAGVTPGLAHRLNLPPAAGAGVPRQQPAPGPVIHPGAASFGPAGQAHPQPFTPVPAVITPVPHGQIQRPPPAWPGPHPAAPQFGGAPGGGFAPRPGTPIGPGPGSIGHPTAPAAGFAAQPGNPAGPGPNDIRHPTPPGAGFVPHPGTPGGPGAGGIGRPTAPGAGFAPHPGEPFGPGPGGIRQPTPPNLAPHGQMPLPQVQHPTAPTAPTAPAPAPVWHPQAPAGAPAYHPPAAPPVFHPAPPPAPAYHPAPPPPPAYHPAPPPAPAFHPAPAAPPPQSFHQAPPPPQHNSDRDRRPGDR
jgi:hypothetical protein